MGHPEKKNTFVFQAGILAAAGMLVKVIGLIYRSPLLSIIGIEGNGYYNAAINIYTIILLISSYSIPSAIAKVIAQRLAFKEYRNAQRVFVCALLYVLIVGGIASILTFVGAPLLVRKNPNAVLALRVLSPTIFFSGFLGVLRGFFQAHGSMVHTSVSQVLEQILNAAVSILAAKLLIGLAADSDETTRAIYGSAGSALGTGAGVLVGLLFMFGMYRLNGSIIRKRVARDKSFHEESYREIFKVIFTIVTPFILSTFIYNCTTVVNMTIYYHAMDYKKVDAIFASNQYGIFSGLAVAVVNIPIAIASAMSSAIMPGIAASYVKGTVAQTRKQVSKAIQMTMLIAIPAAVGIAVLPKPIMQFIFPQKESLDIASGLLAALSVTIVLYSLSTLTNAVLQGIGKVNTPVIHAAAALVIQVVGLVAILLYTDIGLYGLAAANVIYSLVVCVLNQLSVRKHLEYRMNVVKFFLKPLFSAMVMGAVVYGIYHGLMLLVPVSRLVLLVAIAVGVCVYGVIMLLIGGVTEDELWEFPKGGTLVQIAKKLHLLSDWESPANGKKRRRRKKKKRKEPL
ncbi:MAG: polysaccharide biosynthesis protein [Bacteroidales bacterium]|nr:polysaccharide biosynthesis protein [Bacteroidales bacterium]MCM1416708.1 polysaccharide biosynthesis protein [bacterium]MCM1424846.1 polysaccharide biosynthesis protein [bacterium]